MADFHPDHTTIEQEVMRDLAKKEKARATNATTPLEKEIEKRGGDYARDRGQAEYKFTSPGRAAVPDRLHLAPIPEILRPIVAKYIRFVEYKRGGQKPTVPQQREHARLRDMGFVVEVVDNVDDAKRITNEMGG